VAVDGAKNRSSFSHIPDEVWCRIFGTTTRKFRGRKRLVFGTVGRKRDSKNVTSYASGVNPVQIPEMMKLLAGKGLDDCVRYNPETGAAKYRDRASKLRVLKARGMFDKDEVRG
jgi:hypothetical protein